MEAENQPRVSPAKPGLLSVVGTPIGNLSDASPRVLDTLASADVIFCEDTRVTSKLLSAFGLHASLQRCDENVIEAQIAPALKRLAQGQHLAFVSDAGMPGVSDPGQRLVDAVLDAGFATEVVPGPSAVTCALVASGLASEHFFFEGFLPRKHGAQKDRLMQLAAIPATLVIYESPRRVAATLATISEVMPCACARAYESPRRSNTWVGAGVGGNRCGAGTPQGRMRHRGFRSQRARARRRLQGLQDIHESVGRANACRRHSGGA